MIAAGDSDQDNNNSHDATGICTRAALYVRSSDCIELVVCLVFFFTAAFPVYKELMPYERPIPVQVLENSGEFVVNQLFDQDYDGNETVPNFLLGILSGILPLFTQSGLAYFFGKTGDLHITWCLYFTAMGTIGLTTEGIKVYAGYLRPMFMTACGVDENYEYCTLATNIDARKSFLSGHASLSYGGLGLLFLYIHHRFGVPSKDKPTRRSRVVSVLALLPLALATFIAASRLVDNKHHPADVVGGAVLGMALANFFYNIWFTN